MRTFVSLFFTVITVTAVGWYVMYKSNPLNVCEIHPEKSKEEQYLFFIILYSCDYKWFKFYGWCK